MAALEGPSDLAGWPCLPVNEKKHSTAPEGGLHESVFFVNDYKSHAIILAKDSLITWTIKWGVFQTFP